MLISVHRAHQSVIPDSRILFLSAEIWQRPLGHLNCTLSGSWDELRKEWIN